MPKLFCVFHRRKQFLPVFLYRWFRFLVLFYLGTDDKDLPTLSAELSDKGEQTLVISAADTEGVNFLSAGGQLIQC